MSTAAVWRTVADAVGSTYMVVEALERLDSQQLQTLMKFASATTMMVANKIALPAVGQQHRFRPQLRQRNSNLSEQLNQRASSMRIASVDTKHPACSIQSTLQQNPRD